jgi:hypothetical protein
MVKKTFLIFFIVTLIIVLPSCKLPEANKMQSTTNSKIAFTCYNDGNSEIYMMKKRRNKISLLKESEK